MSFDLDRFVKVGTAANAGAITLDDASVINGPALFTYESASDTIAQIAAADYFVGQVFDLKVGDIIVATGSDASNMLIVTASNESTPAVTVESFTSAGVVGTANIEDGAVTNAKLDASAVANDVVAADAAIAFSKLAALTDGNLLVGSAANVATSVAMSGDVTITNAGVAAIASGVIVNADVNASAAIAFSKLAALTDGNLLVGSAANVATSVTMSGDATLANDGALTIAAGAIDNAKVDAAAAIDFSKLAALSDGNILVGSGANVAASVAMSGDATIANTGALTIANDAVTSAKLDPETIQYVEVSVNAASWNGMYAAPVVLVAAGGANTQLVLHRVAFFLDYGGTQFANGGAVHIQYDSTANGAGTKASDTIAAASINGATADSTFALSGAGALAASSTVLNKGLYLSNATGAFDTGTSDFVVRVWYSLASFA